MECVELPSGSVEPGMLYMPRTSQIPEWKIRAMALSLPQHYTHHTRAQEALEERANRLIEAEKYPTGHVEVRGDVVVLAHVPMSGDTLALFGIELTKIGYKIVNYEDSPDYMGY